MFNLIPDIYYDNKLVKNFFRKVKLREDAFSYSTLFTRYSVRDGESPEDVSFLFYKDIKYYWIILLINDIQNINRDWCMSQRTFEEYIKVKYKNNSEYDIKHYITKEIKIGNDVLLKGGLIVEPTFTFSYGNQFYNEITIPVTFREWEYELNEEKRKIFILKDTYLLKYENEFKQLLAYDTSFGISNNIRFNNV